MNVCGGCISFLFRFEFGDIPDARKGGEGEGGDRDGEEGRGARGPLMKAKASATVMGTLLGR